MLENKVEYTDEYYKNIEYTHFYAMMDDWLDAYKIEKALGNKESFYLVQSNYDYYGETIDLYCPKGYGSYVFEDWTGGGREWFGQLPSDYTILDSKGRWHKEGYGFIWDDQAVIPFWNYGKIAEFNKTNKTHYIDLDGDFVYEEKPEALAYDDFLALFNMISLVDYGQMSYDPAEEVLKFEDELRIPAKTAYDHYKSEYSRHDSLASSNNVFRFIKELAQEHEKKTSNQSINDQNIEAKADDSISEEVSLETSPISTDSNSVTEKNNDLETKLLESVNNDGINTQQNVSENNSISVETANSSKESKKEILKEEIPEENRIQLENRPIQDLEIKQDHLAKRDNPGSDYIEDEYEAVGYSYPGELPKNPPSYEESMGLNTSSKLPSSDIEGMGLSPFSETPPSYEESIRTPLSEGGRSVLPSMNDKGMFPAYLEPELRPDLPLEQQYERLIDWFEETNENHHAALESFRSLTSEEQIRLITGLKRIIPESYEYDLPPAYDAVSKASEMPTPETGAIPKTTRPVVYDAISESSEGLAPEEQTGEIIRNTIEAGKNISEAELSPALDGKIIRFQKGTLLDLDGVVRNPEQYYEALLDRNGVLADQRDVLINEFGQANSIQKANLIADAISTEGENNTYYHLLQSFNYTEEEISTLYSDFFYGDFETRFSLLAETQELANKIDNFDMIAKNTFSNQTQSSEIIKSFKKANNSTQKEIIEKIETYRSDTVRDLYTKAGKSPEEIDSLIEKFKSFDINQQQEIMTDLKSQVSESTGEEIAESSTQNNIFQDIYGRLELRNTYDKLRYGTLKNEAFFNRLDQASKEEQTEMLKTMNDELKQNEMFEDLLAKVNYSEEFLQPMIDRYYGSDLHGKEEIIEQINQNIERVEGRDNNRISSILEEGGEEETLESILKKLNLPDKNYIDILNHYNSVGMYEKNEVIFQTKQFLESHEYYLDQLEQMRISEPNFVETVLKNYSKLRFEQRVDLFKRYEDLNRLMDQLDYPETFRDQKLKQFYGANLTEQEEMLNGLQEEMLNGLQEEVWEIEQGVSGEGIYANITSSNPELEDLMQRLHYSEELRAQTIERFQQGADPTEQREILMDLQDNLQRIEEGGAEIEEGIYTEIDSESNENDQSYLEGSEGILDQMDLEIEHSHTGINLNSIPALEERGELESVSPQEIGEDPVNSDINPGESFAEEGEEAMGVLEDIL